MFHLGAALLQNLAVSPELTLRPSLSASGPRGPGRPRAHVSPELTLRPSLSERWPYLDEAGAPMCRRS